MARLAKWNGRFESRIKTRRRKPCKVAATGSAFLGVAYPGVELVYRADVTLNGRLDDRSKVVVTCSVCSFDEEEASRTMARELVHKIREHLNSYRIESVDVYYRHRMPLNDFVTDTPIARSMERKVAGYIDKFIEELKSEDDRRTMFEMMDRYFVGMKKQSKDRG